MPFPDRRVHKAGQLAVRLRLEQFDRADARLEVFRYRNRWIDIAKVAVEESHAQRDAHAGLAPGGQDGVHVRKGEALTWKMIDGRGGAAGEQTVGREQHAQADLIRSSPRRVGLRKPHERRVTEPVSEPGHRARLGVGVRVDQSRDDQAVTAIDAAVRDRRSCIVSRADLGDPLSTDQHEPVVDDRILRVEREDKGIVQQRRSHE